MIRSLLVAIVLTVVLSAQENRSAILGRVADPTGAVVVGAKVTVVNLDTNLAISSSTNDAGNYAVPSLQAGQYRVAVEHPGFKRAENSAVMLQIQQQARLDFTLELGNVAETTSVTAEAPLLTTDDTTLGQVVDNKKILELPLSGRNLSQLTLLGAGVSTSINGISRTINTMMGVNVGLVANGMRDSTNEYAVDGAVVNSSFFNYPIFVPVVDAVQEFKVRTGSYSAEYGGYGGAHIDYALKSGTNDLHATLWEFLRNEKLDARNFFASSTKPPLRQNQFGGMVGGPIVRNRTFFMSTYQGLRRVSRSILQGTVPTAAQRAGDLSLNTAGRPEPQFTDPTTGQPFPGNRIPVTRFSPVAVRGLQFYELPNQAGGVNYRAAAPVPKEEDAVLVKFDHTLSPNNRLAVRYVFQETENPNALPVIADFGTTIPRRAQNATIVDTHTLSPRTILDVRLSWNRMLLKELAPRNGSSFDVRREFQMNIPTTAVPGAIENAIPAFQITGFSGFGDSTVAPLVQPDESYQIAGSVTMLRGKHSLKAGVDFRRIRATRFHGRNTNGTLSFQPGNEGGSGNALADFLLGLPRQTSVVNILSVVDMRQTRPYFFVADNWAVTSRLTLDLGLRYEPEFPIHEPYSRIPIFDFTPPGAFRVLERGDGIFAGDHNNLAPRVGLAWRPISKTVVRASYGVFYSEPKLLGLNVKAINPPLIVNQTFFSSRPNPLFAGDPFPIGLASAGGVPAPNSFQPNRQTAYVQTWSFNIQRSLTADTVLEVGYVGNHAIKMGRQTQLNIPLVPGPGAIQARRPLPNFGPASHFQYDAYSNYHGLQARLEKRFSGGFSVLGAYTYSRSIDLTGDELSGNTLDPNNLNRDRGLSEFNLKSRLSVAYVYDLPFGPGKAALNTGWVAGVLGGWQLSGVTVAHTGRAFTVNAAGDRANLGIETRPNRTCNGALPQGTVERWFDTGCFVQPAIYTIGNLGRGILTGPGFQSWDIGIGKRFHITERHSLQFRAELFNAFNHVNFDNPGATLDTPSFGTILTAGDARSVQFGLKYGF